MRRSVYSSVTKEGLGSVDQGLRSYLQRVYVYMGMGLGLTGLVAFIVASSPALYMPLLFSPLRWVVMFAPLGVVLFLGARVEAIRPQTAQGLFWLYAALMGASLSSILLLYTGESVARIFLITACTFGSMSIYGYTTQKDLSDWGSFLIMGVIGVFFAALVNLFFQSSALQFALSVMTVLIFTGLTAYDTQRIRNMYDASLPQDTQTRMAVVGALQLYIDFVNIFVSLLRLFGDRR